MWPLSSRVSPMRNQLASLAILVCLAACGAGTQLPRTEDGSFTFKFLGLGGNPSEEVGRPVIWRIESSEDISFLVRHSAYCGQSKADHAYARVAGNVVELGYQLSSTTGEVAMAECEYWATFTLSKDVASLSSATFNGDSARLAGTWP